MALVGPSGCGKSTTLALISGLDRASSGSVTVRGKPVDGITPSLGFLFQRDALLPWKTVTDNVLLPLQLRDVTGAQARQRVDEWVGRVGLRGFEKSFPYQLSGGMRKRVALAQTLVYDPEILLMDEPFSALDVQTRNLMEAELLGLWQGSGKTVIFVTHDLEEAIALSDRVVIMSAGPAARIIGDWTVALPRPRDIAEVKAERAFHDLHREIWATLKAEVIKGYAQTDGG